ncbi:hypothetical protein GDO86_017274 [Hymenochirus boettgeri]|nr:hypothetical protein GDO86_017274 [Hymenochirus boettgeri]
MLTVWKIPQRDQKIKIPLPHGIRPETCDVCLFTRDEPDMTSVETEKFYKKLLSHHGVTQITEVIALRRLKKEYKPFESKLRLLGSFDLFLSDDRIRRFLPSLLGKHFYKSKREPQSVNLKSKYLAAELNRYIQGTQLNIINRGCCYAIRVGHTAMKVEDIVVNTVAVAKVLAEKLPMKWKNVKILHLKTQSSVALPVYNSSLARLNELNPLAKISDKKQVEKKKSKKSKAVSNSGTASDALAAAQGNSACPLKESKSAKKEDVVQQLTDEEEEVPQLVPIKSPPERDLKKKNANREKKKSSDENADNMSKKTIKSKPGAAAHKRKVSKDNKVNALETPCKQKKNLQLDSPKTDRKGNNSPKDSDINKTPEKAARKSVRLSKSSKKVPQTPNLKPKKKIPQSA